jgi:hypothetical protein
MLLAPIHKIRVGRKPERWLGEIEVFEVGH